MRIIPPGVQVAPSLLSADFAHLAREIASIEAGGAKVLHLDVMDGHFVPNITFGPPLVRSIRATTELYLDTHLMIRSPLDFLEMFAKSGADLLTVHVEALGEETEDASVPSPLALRDFRKAHEICRDCHVHLGLSFRPRTPPFRWLQVIGADLDLLLLMTVEPGFGGQTFMEGMLPRIRETRSMMAPLGWRARVEVDGGVTSSTAGMAAGAGAELLVAGTAVFGESDRGAAVADLLRAAENLG